MLDFIEKQIIIDYSLSGKQEKLEKLYPNLIKKAQKFLGYETFGELSVMPYGVPVDISDPKF